MSVRRGFRRRLSATMETMRYHVVAWLLSDKEHQSSRFRQNHIDRQLPRYRGDTRCWWRRDFSVHWRPRADRRTGCRSRIVHGVAHDRRLWWSLLSTSAIMSLTAFAVSRSLSGVTFVSEPPAQKPMTGSTRTSSEQCVEARCVGEGQISRN